jgi:hypothetical protein
MGCDVFMSYTSVKDMWGAVENFRDHLEIELRKKPGMFLLRYFKTSETSVAETSGNKYSQKN